MTDIQPIVERLREHAELLLGNAWGRRDGGIDQCLDAKLANEAADRIESLVEALEACLPIVERYESDHGSNWALDAHCKATEALNLTRNSGVDNVRSGEDR